MAEKVKFLAANIKQFVANTYTQTTTEVPESVITFYDKTLLELLRHKMKMHLKFAQKKSMPKNAGDTINFRKIEKLEPALTPLTEGVTPDGNSIGMTQITASTEQYGDFIEITDVVKFKAIDPILTEYIAELADQANETLDILAREELNTGTNVMYAGGKTDRASLAAGDVLTSTDVRKVVRFFRKNYIKPIPGANGDYACLISPDTEFDFFDDSRFLQIAEYGGNVKPLLDNEVGRLHNVRFFMTPNAKVFEAATSETTPSDVHAALFLGKNAYGVTDIKGEGDVKSIIKPLGSSGTEDPLNQRQTAGWKVNAFGLVVLEELALVRYEHVPSV